MVFLLPRVWRVTPAGRAHVRRGNTELLSELGDYCQPARPDRRGPGRRLPAGGAVSAGIGSVRSLQPLPSPRVLRGKQGCGRLQRILAEGHRACRRRAAVPDRSRAVNAEADAAPARWRDPCVVDRPRRSGRGARPASAGV